MDFSKTEYNIAALALVKGLPLMARDSGLKLGRMTALTDRLEKCAGDHLNFAAAFLPNHRLNEIIRATAKFHENTGWEGKRRHICTYASLCLDLIEGLPYVKIKDILVDIVDYYDRAGDFPPASGWSGALAADKFRAIFGVHV